VPTSAIASGVAPSWVQRRREVPDHSFEGGVRDTEARVRSGHVSSLVSPGAVERRRDEGALVRAQATQVDSLEVRRERTIIQYPPVELIHRGGNAVGSSKLVVDAHTREAYLPAYV
jgi:hypothetical protein